MISRFCTFKELNFSNKSRLSVHLMYKNFNWIFMILLHSMNPILFYKNGRSVHLMFSIFHWILTALHFQWYQISQQIWTICTFNVHNFDWIFMVWYLRWFSIEISRFCKFNEFEYFNKFRLSVHIFYTNFHLIFKILYIQPIQTFQQIPNYLYI